MLKSIAFLVMTALFWRKVTAYERNDARNLGGLLMAMVTFAVILGEMLGPWALGQGMPLPINLTRIFSWAEPLLWAVALLNAMPDFRRLTNPWRPGAVPAISQVVIGAIFLLKGALPVIALASEAGSAGFGSSFLVPGTIAGLSILGGGLLLVRGGLQTRT